MTLKSISLKSNHLSALNFQFWVPASSTSRIPKAGSNNSGVHEKSTCRVYSLLLKSSYRVFQNYPDIPGKRQMEKNRKIKKWEGSFSPPFFRSLY